MYVVSEVPCHAESCTSNAGTSRSRQTLAKHSHDWNCERHVASLQLYSVDTHTHTHTHTQGKFIRQVECAVAGG